MLASSHQLRTSAALQMASELTAQAKDYEQDFIRLSCYSLAASVREEALNWVRAIAQTMRDMDTLTLVQLRDKISK
jgi:dynein heavy chain